MAKKINEEAQNAFELLKKEAELRQEINSSFNSYMEGLHRYRTMQKTINRTKKTEADLEADLAEMKKANSGYSAQDILIQEKKIKKLKEYLTLLEKESHLHKRVLADANKANLVLAKSGKDVFKVLTSSVGLIGKGFQKIKSLGLFEMDKAMKNSALSMGILSKQTLGFETTITSASDKLAFIGVSLEEVAKAQAEYSENIGRGVRLNQQSLVTIGEIAKATSLGVEGATALASEFERQGVSAEMTGKFVQNTLDNAHKLGVNASKVIKNISQNIKMLNKYRFKDGAKGLAKMAMVTSKLGVDMEFAAGMADKLWDVEGAVDMAAQLQVMGGAWAKLADPFHLMYMARNDMEGLTTEIANAAKQSMSFAKDGSIEMSAMEMHRLKKIAEQTGVEYDKLVESGKTALKLDKIKGQVSGISGDKDLQEFIANTAEFKDGKATILVGSDEKTLAQLNASDLNTLKTQMREKQSMKDRAEQALTFDDAFTNLVNGMKIFLLPLVKTMDEKLVPALKNFKDTFDKEKWGEKISEFAKSVGNFVSGIGKFVIDNPIVSALAFFGTKFLFNAVQWYANGVALAEGFNTASAIGKGPGAGSVGGAGMFGVTKGAGFMKNFTAASSSKLLKLGGIATLLLTAYNEYQTNKSNGMKTDENLTRAGLKGTGAGLGAWGGAAAGAALGSVVPGIGTLIGGIVGAGLGAWGGGALGEGTGNMLMGEPQHDAMFGKPLSHDFSKNRGILQGGTITPIDNKDDILAMKPGGVVDKMVNSPKENIVDSIKIKFDDININGVIKIDIPGTNGIALDIAKNNEFKREITRVVQTQLEINRNQKNSG